VPELLGVLELLLGSVPELPGILELLGTLGFSADDELGSSVLPSSPEQEKVNAIASTKPAVSKVNLTLFMRTSRC
jgi:hypothetical protein